MQGLAQILPILLVVVVFWFLLIRPQRRRQQQLAATQSSLDVGTEVMLSSGIFGVVSSLEDETIHLDVAAGVTVKVARQAIVRVLDEEQDAPVEPLDETGPDHGADPRPDTDEHRP